jgi:hypothetical protein
MASKNPKTPTPARSTTGPARNAAPRRRATVKTAVPAAAKTDEASAATMPVETAPAASTTAPHQTSIDYAEQIRTRAYFLSLARQGRPGNPVEDWLAAERELGSDAGRNA